MTLEIIIIALGTIAALLAAILAVHNIRELNNARSELDAFEAENFSLQNGIDKMSGECRKLEQELEAERKNSKALQAGNFCNIECFGGLHGYGGDIVKIEYLGRKWEP